MKKMEPIVKKWYDAMEEGKILAMHCNKCGKNEFPPVPICNHCGSTDMEWVEMDRAGKMVAFSPVIFLDPLKAKFGPHVVVQVKFADGNSLQAPLTDYDIDSAAVLYDRLPVEVEMVILDRDGYKFPGFKIKEA
jgi:uncharacterized OB-fold protein